MAAPSNRNFARQNTVPLPAPTRAPHAMRPQARNSHIFKWLLLGSVIMILLGAGGIFGMAWFGLRKATEYGYDTELAQREPELAVYLVVLKNRKDVTDIQVDKVKAIITYRLKLSGRQRRVTFDGKLKDESVEGDLTVDDGPVNLDDGPIRPVRQPEQPRLPPAQPLKRVRKSLQ